MGKPFGIKRLEAIRRLRKARRLFKQQPLFAYQSMCEQYPAYCYSDFLADLRYRKPPVKRKPKSRLIRYGRYMRMVELIQQYKQSGNIDDALSAKKLWDHMSKPYRVCYRREGVLTEVFFSPLTPLIQIENLVLKLKSAITEREADLVVDEFRKTAHIY